MNKKVIFFSILITVCICASLFACGNGEKENTKTEEASTVDSTKMPLNISIYLDLSDRLIRELTPSQKDRDSEIVSYLCKMLKEHSVAQKILPSKDRIKVFFYPSPNDPKISLLSEDLEVDLGKAKPAEKKKILTTFEEKFKTSLDKIYASTLENQNWIGSDIWGFFNKPVDTYCIKEGARNIIVVLTDGYIYYAPNKQNDGDSYNYILPQTLTVPNSSLMVSRSGLDNLEVLMLEVNPLDPKQQTLMENILSDWFKGMGVKKFYVGETDQPSNTRLIIDKFME